MTDREIIEHCKELIEGFKKEIEKYQSIIDLLTNKIGVANSNVADNQIVEPKEVESPIEVHTHPTENPINTQSFKAIVANILKKEGKPFLTKDLLKEFNKVTGRDLIFNTFSGQFSSVVKKNNVIKKYINESGGLENRYYYGLIEWFDGETLKPEYIEKIKAT